MHGTDDDDGTGKVRSIGSASDLYWGGLPFRISVETPVIQTEDFHVFIFFPLKKIRGSTFTGQRSLPSKYLPVHYLSLTP